MASEKFLDVSWPAIFKISLAVILFYILFSIKEIFVWFVFAVIISLLFNPLIDFLQKRKIPRIIATIFVYVGFLGIFSWLIYLVVPIFVFEIKQFLQVMPDYFERISPLLRGLGFETFENFEGFLNSFGDTLEKMATNIFNGLFAFFGGVFSALFVIITAFFLSMEERIIEKWLIILFPKKYETSALSIWQKCQKKVAAWFGARILSCLFIGLACFVTFLLFRVKYSFTLALFAGVFNFIPYVGPAISGILLTLIILPISILKAFFVLIVFILIQQIENSILSPILMKRIVGLSPVLVLVALIIGGKLWGILGAILAVPLAGILIEFIREFLQKRKEKETVVV